MAGRTPVNIDWTKVEEYAEADCSGVEIASAFGVHYDTLVNHFKKEFKQDIEDGLYSNFSDYMQEKKRKGNADLKLGQHKKAKKGDNTMLVWLGKNRLGQSDKQEKEVTHKGAIDLKERQDILENLTKRAEERIKAKEDEKSTDK